jgi:hypothetical protein
MRVFLCLNFPRKIYFLTNQALNLNCKNFLGKNIFSFWMRFLSSKNLAAKLTQKNEIIKFKQV